MEWKFFAAYFLYENGKGDFTTDNLNRNFQLIEAAIDRNVPNE